MAASTPSTPLPPADLAAFVAEVSATLRAGQKFKIDGLGTFTICTRKATPERPACTMAMFRASPALRAFVSGGPPTAPVGPHAALVRQIAHNLADGVAFDLPALGYMAAVSAKGKSPKIVFHGDPALNDTL